MTDVAGQLAIAFAVTEMTDADLPEVAYDAAAVLSMGEGGIGTDTVDRLRHDLLAAVDELARRWQAHP